MQMRCGDAAGGAGEAEELAVLHGLAALHVDAGEVGVEGVDAEAVVEEHGVSGEEEVLREDDAASVRRMDGCAGRGVQVGAGVRGARFAVEDAARSEIRSRLARNGIDERLLGDDVAVMRS